MRTRLAVLAVTAVGVVAVGALVSVASAPRAVHAAGGGGSCFNGYFAGLYGFAGEGSTNGGQPIAYEGGLLAIPNTTPGATNGTLQQGNLTVTRLGSTVRETFTGTFQMSSSSCGGTAVLTTSTGRTLHYDFDVNQWSTGISQEVNFIETDRGSVVVLSLTHA